MGEDFFALSELAQLSQKPADLLTLYFANRLQAVCVDLYRGGVSFHFITILLLVNIMKLTNRDSHDTSSTRYIYIAILTYSFGI